MKQRLLWILVPTLVTAAATATLSYFFMPTRYQSESVLIVMPQRVPPDVVRPSVESGLSERLIAARQQVLSRTRLERLIKDFNVYPADRTAGALDAVVRRMRDDIRVTVDTQDIVGKHEGIVRVAFRAANPGTAMRVTERLAGLLIEESLREREMVAEGTNQFLQAQQEDLRRQIVAKEGELKALRAKTGGDLSQADVLPYEVLKERYKSLLIKAQEAKIAANLERRQIGEQWKLLDPARLPEAPVGPSRTNVTLAGALVGLGFGAVAIVLSTRQKN